MSHFTVLVIGPDLEKQLQTFHEFECTGINDEHVQDVDVTEECREHGLDWHGLEDSVVESEDQVDRDGAHKYGYAVMKDGELVKAVNRTNPNKQWDWWVLGGRWSGFLKLKPGADGALGRPGLMGSRSNDGPGYADQATKGAVDFDGMRDEAGAKHGEQWDKANAILSAEQFLTWEEVAAGYPGDVEAARAAYWAQPAAKQFSEAFGPFVQASNFKVPREEYVQRARDGAASTFAVLKDGQWYGRGSMGWWGCVSDEKDPNDWNRKVSELLDGLADDTLLSVVDCHI